MKKITLLFTFLAVAAVLSTSCNKSSESDNSFDEYYVRYTASVSNPQDTISVSYRMPDGHSTRVKDIYPDGRFQVTVGPVIAGYQATIVSNLTIGSTSPTLSIETSKGAGPFVMKATRDNAITLSYVVGD